MHNVYILEYLFLRTEQAGTYLKSCHLLYHSTYICPILFSPKEHGEISIFVIFSQLFPCVIYKIWGMKRPNPANIQSNSIIPLQHIQGNFGYRRIVHCAMQSVVKTSDSQVHSCAATSSPELFPGVTGESFKPFQVIWQAPDQIIIFSDSIIFSCCNNNGYSFFYHEID